MYSDNIKHKESGTPWPRGQGAKDIGVYCGNFRPITKITADGNLRRIDRGPPASGGRADRDAFGKRRDPIGLRGLQREGEAEAAALGGAHGERQRKIQPIDP